MTVRLVYDDGTSVPLDAGRWHAGASDAEMALLRSLRGPVLDVGCGPGRLVVGLGRLGVAALGVDPAPGAVRASRQRGAAVLQRSVFERLPAEGRWQTALLADGNIGIGGDPVRLLARCGDLVAESGAIVVEVAPPGVGCRRVVARLEGRGAVGPWFDWAEVGADGISAVAAAAGQAVVSFERVGPRWFAVLGRVLWGMREPADAVA